jgi:DNA (cytosine-5)-methyltransferase 1
LTSDFSAMTRLTEFSGRRKRSGLSLDQLAESPVDSAHVLRRYENGSVIPPPPVIETLRGLSENNGPGRERFRFVDLFAGIGGLRRGFDGLGGKCVFTCEWNSFARQTYRANFPDGDDHLWHGDITTIDAKDIPRHDLLLAGFPCQPFSIAGISKKIALGRAHGFNCETQGTLFFDVARVIAHHQPRAFLLENVKNLLSHDRGRTFDVIRRTLAEELGYQVHWKVINAKSFVPQNRERIFIAGFREPNAFNFDDLVLPDPLRGPRLGQILHPENGSELPEGHYTTGSQATVCDRYTLTNGLWTYLQDYAAKHAIKGNGFGFGLNGPDDIARTLSARYYKDGSEILIQQQGRSPRRLTPRECARLMGFDEPGGPEFKIPVSDTQAYKQFGNAVVVPVVKAVARQMAPFIVGSAVIPDSAPKRRSSAKPRRDPAAGSLVDATSLWK